MISKKCPVCGSSELDALYPEHDGACVTSDMVILQASSLKNRLCVECGLIFNAGGTRGATERFYHDSYKMMTGKSGSAMQSFSGPQPVNQAKLTYDVLRDLIDVPSTGRVLDAGAGKGEFLSYFSQGLPDWQISAFEPSSAFEVLQSCFPQA